MNSIFSKKLKKKVLHMIQCQVYHIQSGMQISYSVHTKIQEKNFLWTKKDGNRKDIERFM